MKHAIIPSGQSENEAYHPRVNPGRRRYRKGVITQPRTGPCGLCRHCKYNDDSKSMHIALIFIHILYYTIFQNIIMLS